MLEVHPPHEIVHTWKDFFIHLATIVIGLLIALGIENVVERVHTAYELKETREALDNEMRSNVSLLTSNSNDWIATFIRLKNNLIVLQYLQQHPGATHADLPGTLNWAEYPFDENRAVWDSAVSKGTIRLLPLAEANRYQLFYMQLDVMAKMSSEAWDAINYARRFDILYPDPTSIPLTMIPEIVDATNVALSKVVKLGYALAWSHKTFPEYSKVITYEKVEKLRPDAEDIDKDGMAAAKRRTNLSIENAIKEFGQPIGEKKSNPTS